MTITSERSPLLLRLLLPLERVLLLLLRLLVVPVLPFRQRLGPGVVLARLPETEVLGDLPALGRGRGGCEGGPADVHGFRPEAFETRRQRLEPHARAPLLRRR